MTIDESDDSATTTSGHVFVGPLSSDCVLYAEQHGGLPLIQWGDVIVVSGGLYNFNVRESNKDEMISSYLGEPIRVIRFAALNETQKKLALL